MATTVRQVRLADPGDAPPRTQPCHPLLRLGPGVAVLLGMLASCAGEQAAAPAASDRGAAHGAPAPLRAAVDPATGDARPVQAVQHYQAASGRTCAQVRLVNAPTGRRVACRAGQAWVLVPDLIAALGGP